MTIRSLAENYSGTPGWAVGLVDSYEMGMAWRTTDPAPITHLGWYRGANGSAGRPLRLRIWDSVSLQQVAHVSPAEDNELIGWQWSLLPEPILPLPNRTYIVAYTIPAGGGWATVTTGSMPAPSAGLERVTPIRRYNTNGPNLFPQTSDNAVVHLVDFKMDTESSGPEPPVTETTLANELSAWLDETDSAVNPGSLPRQTHILLTDPDEGLPKILADINTLSGNVLTAESAILGDIIAKIDTVDDILGLALGPTGSLATGALRSYLDGLKTTIDDTLALQQRVMGGSQSAAPTTDPGWTLADTGAFTGSFEVAERCDRVYVSVDASGSGAGVDTYLGHEYLTRYFWWHPVFNAHAGDYRTQRAVSSVLLVPAMRMDGVRVICDPTLGGTWEAWRFDG